MVHVENIHGRTTNGRSPHDACPTPAEMALPHVATRMEQTGQLSIQRISPGNIGPFLEIAMETREREILHPACATMLLGNDVVDLKGRAIVGARHPAVLAGAVRTLPDPRFD